VFLAFSEHDCLPPVQSLLSNDLFAALKEVIAAKSRAARQQKFSSPTRLSLRAFVETLTGCQVPWDYQIKGIA